MSIFSEWSDDQLRDLSRVLDAAWGEGLEMDAAVINDFIGESTKRGIRLPYAWWDGSAAPDIWLREQRGR